MRTIALPLALAAVLAAGCATRQSMDSAYDRSLSAWQGQTEETLRARWGKPASEEQTPNGKWLTYVVDNPASVSGGGPRIGIGIGGFGGGGRVGLGGGVGLSAPIAGLGGSGGNTQVASCTTRFLVENGKVSSWTFDGAGCGAGG
jgi:hypothetical protein